LWIQQRDGEEIRRLLSTLQAPVRQCASGQEAVELARATPLACAIAPLEMPDMGPGTLIESLQEVAPGLAVIFIADNPAVSEAVTAMKTGAHAVIDSRILSSGLLVHVAPLLRSR
jgi:DNA-binding NtrC family response regulator